MRTAGWDQPKPLRRAAPSVASTFASCAPHGQYESPIAISWIITTIYEIALNPLGDSMIGFQGRHTVPSL
jgi:hypothetical protein